MFRDYRAGQTMLLPPSLDEWLPAEHLARFVDELVEQHLDLGPFYAAHTNVKGFAPYDPRMMLKVLLYGYLTGVPSSRAERCEQAATEATARAVPKPTAQCNFTAPESRLMKTSDGSLHQCYNVQAVADKAQQVIVATELSAQAADAPHLPELLDATIANTLVTVFLAKPAADLPVDPELPHA